MPLEAATQQTTIGMCVTGSAMDSNHTSLGIIVLTVIYWLKPVFFSDLKNQQQQHAHLVNGKSLSFSLTQEKHESDFSLLDEFQVSSFLSETDLLSFILVFVCTSYKLTHTWSWRCFPVMWRRTWTCLAAATPGPHHKQPTQCFTCKTASSPPTAAPSHRSPGIRGYKLFLCTLPLFWWECEQYLFLFFIFLP